MPVLFLLVLVGLDLLLLLHRELVCLTRREQTLRAVRVLLGQPLPDLRHLEQSIALGRALAAPSASSARRR